MQYKDHAEEYKRTCTKAFKLKQHKKQAMQKDKLQQTQHSLHNKQIGELHTGVNNVKGCKTNTIMIKNAECDNQWKTKRYITDGKNIYLPVSNHS
jgi:hypothetical protein